MSPDTDPSPLGCIPGALAGLFGRAPATSAEAPSTRFAAVKFDLRITFTGMCLFMPDKMAKEMHVVLPKLSNKLHRHVAVLQFDAAHLNGDQVNPPKARLGVPVSVGMRELRLVLGDGSGISSAKPALCEEIVDIFPVTKKPVDPDHLKDDTKKKIVGGARLTAGEMTGVSPGVCWNWNGGATPRPIAHRAEWTIPDLTGPKLDIVLKGLHGKRDLALPSLFPVQPGGADKPSIALTVWHVPSDDLPPDEGDPEKIEPGEHPPHFEGFYDLFGGPVSNEVPTLVGDSGCTVATPCKKIASRGGSPYTCMVAGVVPSP
ncbi:MAG TPA: hypothetical protein VFJ82_25615 [Longimicrobium sp.]|nr:hypothetical protein [Longimicrobium sp.]